MEFYSERCQDWLEKSDRIHPDKLAMELERFKKMHEACSEEDQESKEDLALTVQLLQERLTDDLNHLNDQSNVSASHSSTVVGAGSSSDVVVASSETIESSSETNADAYVLSESPRVDDMTWDLSSLSNPENIEVETLDLDTKVARKQALLDHPSIALGVAGIKNNNR